MTEAPREKRETRGKRVRDLTPEEKAEDEAFWQNNPYFASSFLPTPPFFHLILDDKSDADSHAEEEQSKSESSDSEYEDEEPGFSAYDSESEDGSYSPRSGNGASLFLFCFT